MVNQKITIDKDLNFKTVEVLDSNDIPQMIMQFNNIDLKANFDDNYFDLDSIIEQIDIDQNNNSSNSSEDEETSTIDDIIYPLYIPTGTALVDKEKVSKTDGERVILTFDGEKPFLLVEETASVEKEFSIVPTYGEPFLLADTVVSDAMSQIELIEIANSISAIPTMK